MTSCCGLVLTIGRMLYKSKCSVIRCCGCEIDRNVDDETRIDLRSNSKEGEEKV